MLQLLRAPRTPWAPKFPPVIGNAAYSFMRSHPEYRSAKDGLSDIAALALVADCLVESRIEQIRQIVGHRTPRIVAVHAEEATGRNKIPLAYAEILANKLGLQTDPRIVQASVANHGGAKTIYHRFVSQPTFAGQVVRGSDYILIDDTCTAGGTLANLKGFIERCEGVVIGMSVLALAKLEFSYEISLAESTLARLKYRHSQLEDFWNQEFGCGIETLTEGEAGHLLKAPTVDSIRNRLIEARRDLDIAGNEKTDQGAA